VDLHESAEMYLETILVLSREKSSVRRIDVAESLGYSKPSVSRAVGFLIDGGYIISDQEGLLSLSELGMQTAQKIYERHTVLSRMLIDMGVSEKTAAEDACKIEHIISDESMEMIKKYMNK